MGAGGEDIQLSPHARKWVPYQIECKSKGKSAVHTMYEQAASHGKHRKKPLAVVDADHFFQLLKQLGEIDGN
jgi:mannose-1-phosphate guanylyltransferase